MQLKSYDSHTMRRAMVVPLVAVCLLLLVGFIVLAVDAGYIYVSRTEMQRAADAGALAGASALPEGEEAVTERALECTGWNAVARSSVSVDEADVILGSWEWNARTFYPQTGDESVFPNAVRVVGSRTDMPLFFARAIGVSGTDVIKRATSLGGGGVCAGVWGLEGVRVTGDASTDSYSSEEGGYGDGPIYSNGDLCSCEDIDLAGGVEIHGDAMYGEGYEFDTAGSSYEVWGIVGEHRCGPYVPDFDMEEAAAINDNGTIGLTDAGRDPFQHPWDLRLIEDDNVTLTGGSYYFTSVTMVGQATLTVSGPTTIYVSDTAKFTGGGITNVTEDPANLTIYATGRNVTFSGTSALYASVIAPDSDITMLGTVDYYGTILAETLTVHGTFNMHVDEAVVFDLFDIEPTVPVLVE